MITNNSLPNRYNYQLNDDLYEILELIQIVKWKTLEIRIKIIIKISSR